MEKIIFLIFLLLLTNACSVNYKLTIDEENQFFEDITIQAENASESQEIYNDPWPIKVYYKDPDSGEYPEKLEGVEYYQDNVSLNNNFYQKKLSYTFNQRKFYDVNSIKTCYEHFYMNENETEKTITLSTSAEFLCMANYTNLNEVNIEIQVENPVVDSNASSVDGNVYKWQITRDNYEHSGIILTYKKQEIKNQQKTQEEKQEETKRNLVIAYILVGIFLIFIVGMFIYKIKKTY